MSPSCHRSQMTKHYQYKTDEETTPAHIWWSLIPKQEPFLKCCANSSRSLKLFFFAFFPPPNWKTDTFWNEKLHMMVWNQMWAFSLKSASSGFVSTREILFRERRQISTHYRTRLNNNIKNKKETLEELLIETVWTSKAPCCKRFNIVL